MGTSSGAFIILNYKIHFSWLLMKERAIQKREEQDMVLNDILYKYSTITIYSKNGGAVYPWDRKLLKHYKDRPVLRVWVNPVDVHAYVQIG